MYIIFDKNTIINMDNVYSVELGRNEEDTNIYFYSGWDHAMVKHQSRDHARFNFDRILAAVKESSRATKLWLEAGA